MANGTYRVLNNGQLIVTIRLWDNGSSITRTRTARSSRTNRFLGEGSLQQYQDAGFTVEQAA